MAHGNTGVGGCGLPDWRCDPSARCGHRDRGEQRSDHRLPVGLGATTQVSPGLSTGRPRVQSPRNTPRPAVAARLKRAADVRERLGRADPAIPPRLHGAEDHLQRLVRGRRVNLAIGYLSLRSTTVAGVRPSAGDRHLGLAWMSISVGRWKVSCAGATASPRILPNGRLYVRLQNIRFANVEFTSARQVLPQIAGRGGGHDCAAQQAEPSTLMDIRRAPRPYAGRCTAVIRSGRNSDLAAPAWVSSGLPASEIRCLLGHSGKGILPTRGESPFSTPPPEPRPV
jgi:hypothetical protein